MACLELHLNILINTAAFFLSLWMLLKIYWNDVLSAVNNKLSFVFSRIYVDDIWGNKHLTIFKDGDNQPFRRISSHISLLKCFLSMHYAPEPALGNSNRIFFSADCCTNCVKWFMGTISIIWCDIYSCYHPHFPNVYSETHRG